MPRKPESRWLTRADMDVVVAAGRARPSCCRNRRATERVPGQGLRLEKV